MNFSAKIAAPRTRVTACNTRGIDYLLVEKIINCAYSQVFATELAKKSRSVFLDTPEHTQY